MKGPGVTLEKNHELFMELCDLLFSVMKAGLRDSVNVTCSL